MARKVVYLVPQPGMKIPDPKNGGNLPEVGRRVELNTYWSRRISEGCVLIKNEGEKK